MEANKYQELALMTKSPNGTETFQRFINSCGVYESGMQKLMDTLNEIDFDNLKRIVFYNGPGLQTLPSESDQELNLIHGILGLVSELFEKIELIRIEDTIDPVHLKEELGDLLWYISLIASSQGIELKDVMESNIRKLALRNRNKGKFDLAGTLERELDRERAILEGDIERNKYGEVGLSQKQKEQLQGYNSEKLTEDIGCSTVKK